jgi:hypothetical protein
VAVTGFDSSIGLLRLFLDPTDPGRFPSSVAVYYSTVSTTSIDSTAPSYSGTQGDTLLSMLSLSPGLLTPVPGAHAGYLNIPVDAPSGTQTLLLDLGSANGEGDRISELQAFAVPEPNPLTFIAIAMVAFPVLRRPRSNRRMADMLSVRRSVPWSSERLSKPVLEGVPAGS